MRIVPIFAAVAAIASLAGAAGVGHGHAAETLGISSGTGPAYAEGNTAGLDTFANGDACDPCADACSRGRRRGQYEGLDPYANCSCNGSYKYPVPPLYTYHWPGMYSAQLMTEYHSPWRFPPLKRYMDEVPPIETASRRTRSNVQPVSTRSLRASNGEAEFEPMSSRLLRSRP